MAVNESGLHAFDSIAADYVTRLDEFHTGQLCRLFKESIRRDLDTRRDGTAQIFAFFGDTAESRRRSEIDDDQWSAVFGLSYFMTIPVLMPGPTSIARILKYLIDRC